MKNFKISLYGNLILDNIFFVKNLKENQSNKSLKSLKSVGAIGNLVNAIKLLDNKITIEVHSQISNDDNGKFIINNLKSKIINNIEINNSLQTSNAVIIVDLEKQDKTSVVDWGACTEMKNFNFVNSDWNHFLYIDTLKHLNKEKLENFKNSIISADLCLSDIDKSNRESIFELFTYIDYLIISHNELDLFFDEKFDFEFKIKFLANKLKGFLILHSKEGTYFCNGNKMQFLKNEILDVKKHINVLGAGDFFVSCFMIFMLKEKRNIEECVEFCNKKTQEFIKNR